MLDSLTVNTLHAAQPTDEGTQPGPIAERLILGELCGYYFSAFCSAPLKEHMISDVKLDNTESVSVPKAKCRSLKESGDRSKGWTHSNNFAPYSPMTAKKLNGFKIPAERINQFRYCDNWIHNFNISASLGKYRNAPLYLK